MENYVEPNLKFGVLPSPEDNRDYQISQFIPNKDTITDEQFCLKLPELEIIIDQGQIGACVAHSLATCKSILEYNALNKWIDFSPFMLYGDRESTDHQGYGMYASQALNNLLKKGMWLRRDFDKRYEVPFLYQFITSAKTKNPNLVTNAKDYTITAYSRLYNESNIKTALKNGMPVIACWTLYASFYNVGSNGKVKTPNTTEGILGNHAMTIVGWTSNSWIVVNSWGVNWAHKGMYYIPFDYLPFEAWSISDKIYPALKKAKEVKLTIDSSKILIDNVEKEIDAVPQIINDRTYLPVRVISEALGCSVEWDEINKEITIRSEEAIILLKINSTDLIVNNTKYKMDVVPLISNNRTILPVRFISEYLNCDVFWNNDDRVVTIVSK